MYKRIKELRIEKGESQLKVSTILGIEQSYYSKLELGKHEISVKDLKKIAEYFNVSTDYILERTNRKEVNKWFTQICPTDKKLTFLSCFRWQEFLKNI